MKKINYSKIEKEIAKYEYISFDIFDTLIIRNIEKPIHLFEIMERKFNKENKTKLENWVSIRHNAEKKARLLCNDEEITLDEIYEQIELEEDIKKRLKKLEIEIELNICKKNNRIYKIYEIAKRLGKKIIITSDMYLDESVINKILNKNGILYYKMYLSSTLKLTKYTGSIFKYILSDLKCKNKEIIHFGDNKKSDYIRPMLNGIHAELVEISSNINYENKKDVSDENKFDYQCLKSFINNNIDVEKNYFWKVGYEIFGPLLYGYSKWLEKQFLDNCYSNIYFLSRDGYIMKKAFELCCNIKSTYIYASRRALIVPTIWMYDDFEDLKKNMYMPRKIKLKSFLKKLGLDEKKYEDILKKYNYSLEDELYTDELTEENLKFYKEIKNEIYTNSKVEYENLIKYYKNINFTGKVAIVDIGWFGNMQLALDNILKRSELDVNIDGYYVGIVPESDKQDKLNMKGYLFERNREELYLKKKFFNSIFEIVFLAHHGSARRYTSDVNVVELYEYEYENTKTEKEIADFQNGALAFVEDFNKSGINEYIDFNEYLALYNFMQFGNYPTKLDIKNFGNMQFFDDDVKKLINNKNLIYYIFHINELKEDLLNSIWKTGFLKKILKINLDYYKIIIKFRNKYKK